MKSRNFKIDPDIDLKPLMVGVITQAIEDLHNHNPLKAISAAAWLTGEDIPLWLEACGLAYTDGYRLLTDGKVRDAITKIRVARNKNGG